MSNLDQSFCSAKTVLESEEICWDVFQERRTSAAAELFAVIDACDEPLVPGMVQQLGDRGTSLYQGRTQQTYWDVAPYLVHVDQDLLKWLRDEMSDRPWGFLIESFSQLADLRRHLRRYVMLRTEQRDYLLFRFYDPRLLPAWLSSCDSGQLEAFFGPADAFVTSSGTEVLTRWTRQPHRRNSAPRATNDPQLITDTQIHQLADAAQLDFQRRLESHLLDALDEVSPAKVRRDIELGMRCARQFGISRECDVAWYVELVCRELGGFERRHPLHVEDILYDRRLEPAERLLQLQQCLASPGDEEVVR